MRVRAVTVGWTSTWNGGRIVGGEELGRVVERVRAGCAESGLELQSVRLATQPFPTIVAPGETAALASALCRLPEAWGFDYVSMGPVRPRELAWCPGLLEALVAEERLFAALAVTDEKGTLSLPAVRWAAEIIAALSRRTPAGLGNLRFAALALCPPGIPFFPAAYHDGGPLAFSVAWEAADEVGEAFAGAESLAEAERRLRERLTARARQLAAVAERLAGEVGARFLGIDVSLAPHPEITRSIAGAIERLGVQPFGGVGTLTVIASLTRVLRDIPVPRTGFCGVMLPVLEDAVLGLRAGYESVSLPLLLAAAAVCGVGLDVVPLPGETTVEQLAAIVLDTATLATRLGKPLTARLMPVPGKRAGEPVEFDFPYFAPARILPVVGTIPSSWFALIDEQNTQGE